MLNDILLVFIPMFFTVDPIGILPVFASLTQGLTPQEKREIIFQSLVTASLVAVGFIFLGKVIFHFLGITMGDFMVAGGVILFCLGDGGFDLPGQNPSGCGFRIGSCPDRNAAGRGACCFDNFIDAGERAWPCDHLDRLIP